jgi:hypothetical protein
MLFYQNLAHHIRITKMKIHKIYCLCILILFVSALDVYAQTNVQCGSILEGEFTEDKSQNYMITLAPGDVLEVSGETLGDYLQIRIDVDAPTTGTVASSNTRVGRGTSDSPRTVTDVLSERGIYTITVKPDGLGIYSLYVSCTLRDGTVIQPGDTAPQNTDSSTAPVAPSFSGVGFPGLQPVDFSAVAKIPMIAGTPMTGAVTPTGGEILGYTLDAAGGEVVDLSVSKLSGNLNLGVVVLSADNEVVFQASLVTSQSLTTRLTLPSAGQYTIGVFRVDLLPPDSPEATAFQVQATVNPG